MLNCVQTFCTNAHRLFTRGVGIFVLMLYASMYTSAQNSLACNDLVQVSLDQDCEAEIYPDIILEGTYPDTITWRVQIQGVVGNTVTTPGTYKVTITNMDDGNSCWGNILVEDKLAPILDCLCPPGNDNPDCDYLCTDQGPIQNGTLILPAPVVDENCSTVTSSKSDVFSDGVCGGKVLTRTWIYTDASGNSSTCTQEFRLNPVDFEDVMRPISPVTLDCGEAFQPNDIVNYFTPLVGLDSAYRYAYPTVNGHPITQQMCNIMATKTDIATDICEPSCSNSKKVIRRWVVLDWCSGKIDVFTQIIKAADITPPPSQAYDVTVSVDPWGCEASIVFAPPSILHDACTDFVQYRVEGPVGVNVVWNAALQRWTATDIPLGVNLFRYVGLDCCDNIGVDTVSVSVLDLTAPVAVAKEHIVVSLTSSGGIGQAKIYAASVDNGSHDGCTPVHLEIRRDTDNCDIDGNTTYNNDGHLLDSPTDSDDGQYVKFCCEDLTDVDPDGVSYGRVKVWLRVWDDGDQNGVYGSAGDNYNETWAMVRVDDKLPATITCPANVTVECTVDVYDLSLTGNATAKLTCGTAAVDYTDLSDTRTGCGDGEIVRRFFIVDQPAVRCTQRIMVNSSNLFNGNITWPSDRTVNCTNLGGLEEPTWIAPPCSAVGYSLQSDTFQFVDNACLKILNQYTVIDWCQYDPNGNTQTGIWRHTQVIKVEDDEAPTLDSCENIMVAINDHSDVDNDGNICEAKNITVTNAATDAGNCPSRRMKWEIRIDINGDGPVDFEYTSFVSSNDNTFDDDNGNGIPDRYIAPTASGQTITVNIPTDLAGPMSNHKVHWKVTDGCGNITSCTTTIMAVDKKAPTPYCVNLSSALMDITGKVEIWASDFNLGSFDNCTDAEDLLYTFNRSKPIASQINMEHFFKGDGLSATASEYNVGLAQRWLPSLNSSAMIFDCDDTPFVNLEMTVHDEKGNYDYCDVQLRLIDNFDNCSGMRILASGLVYTEDGEPMEGVEVVLDPDVSEINRYTTSDENGLYTFDDVIPGINYKISANLSSDHKEGISTLDLVMIQRHILQIKDLDSPYKIIAADINNDQSVRGSDVVQLRKMILGITDEFEGNESWKFIDASYVFADPTAPFPVPAAYSTGIVNDDIEKDIVAVKVGDVNLSVSRLQGNHSTEVRESALTMFVEDRKVSAGDILEIPLRLAEGADVAGLQLSLNLESAEVLDIIAGSLSVSASDAAIINEEFRLAFAGRDNATVAHDDVLFTIKLSANSSGLLSDLISLSQTLSPEMYIGNSATTRKVELGFVRPLDLKAESFQLFQNQPNPFKEETVIGFNLPEAADATLTVYDISGKLIYNMTDAFEKGHNSITLRQSQLPVSGVLYYKLESGTHIATRKMIQIQ